MRVSRYALQANRYAMQANRCAMRVIVLALMALLTTVSWAAEKSDEANVVLHSTITGNQEQPKVLYIVPWQPPGSADKLMQPIKPMLDDVFAPVDRAEFNRELKLREKASTDIQP